VEILHCHFSAVAILHLHSRAVLQSCRFGQRSFSQLANTATPLVMTLKSVPMCSINESHVSAQSAKLPDCDHNFL
jgi:hypothetical protein